MDIVESTEVGVRVIALRGRLDVNTASDAEHAFKPLFHLTEPHIVLDLSEVDYISSGGLGMVLMLRKTVEARGGRLALCRLHDRVLTTFHATNLDARFEVFDTREEAVAALAT